MPSSKLDKDLIKVAAALICEEEDKKGSTLKGGQLNEELYKSGSKHLFSVDRTEAKFRTDQLIELARLANVPLRKEINRNHPNFGSYLTSSTDLKKNGVSSGVGKFRSNEAMREFFDNKRLVCLEKNVVALEALNIADKELSDVIKTSVFERLSSENKDRYGKINRRLMDESKRLTSGSGTSHLAERISEVVNRGLFLVDRHGALLRDTVVKMDRHTPVQEV